MSSTGSNDDFGFVAGRAVKATRAQRDGVLSDVLDGVAMLLDWRKRTAFQSDATVRMGSDSTDYRVTARPRELSYEVVNAQSGTIESFDPRTGIIREGTSERPIEANQLAMEPMAVRLAFPLSLGIWGRPGDSYRLTGARRTKDELIVLLAHQTDTGLVGELVIDHRRRSAIRLDTPTLGIEYRDIQPDH